MDPVHGRGSMDPVHESDPWTRSKVGVHGPLVHDFSFSQFLRHIEISIELMLNISLKMRSRT